MVKNQKHFLRNPRRKSALSNTQKLVLSVIAINAIIILILIPCAIFLTPENLVKSKISSLTSEYYEKHFYHHLIESETNIAETLGEYNEIGLATIPLRQILWHNHEKHEKDINFITKYCNENQSFIKIYPEPPYKYNSYRVEYTYSCEF